MNKHQRRNTREKRRKNERVNDGRFVRWMQSRIFVLQLFFVLTARRAVSNQQTVIRVIINSVVTRVAPTTAILGLLGVTTSTCVHCANLSSHLSPACDRHPDLHGCRLMMAAEADFVLIGCLHKC